MRVIDAARAQRAREIYESALSQPETPADSKEWIELEEVGVEFKGRACGVKHSNAHIQALRTLTYRCVAYATATHPRLRKSNAP